MHRIGRTGRAGREGVAITLAEPREHRLLRNIEAFTKQKIEHRDAADGGGPARAPARVDARGAATSACSAADFDDVRVVVDSLAQTSSTSPTSRRRRSSWRTWPRNPVRTRAKSSRRRRSPRAVPRSVARPSAAAANRPPPRPGSSSALAVRAASDPEIWSAPSPARPASARATSAQSRSPIVLRSSKCLRTWRTPSSTRCERRPSRVTSRRSGANARTAAAALPPHDQAADGFPRDARRVRAGQRWSVPRAHGSPSHVI